jgi:hypothetical protein
MSSSAALATGVGVDIMVPIVAAGRFDCGVVVAGYVVVVLLVAARQPRYQSNTPRVAHRVSSSFFRLPAIASRFGAPPRDRGQPKEG